MINQDLIELKERFFEKVNKEGPIHSRLGGRCWEWTAFTNPKGYGMFKIEGATRLAHRVSWRLHRGPIPEGALILHQCDNRPCVNPDHLRIGTHVENMAAMARRKRANRPTGERSPTAKLAWKEVREIRHLYSTGRYTYQDLSERYGVSAVMIGNIVRYDSWQEDDGREEKLTAVLEERKRHSRSKLSEEDVYRIRKLNAAGGLTHTEIARLFSVSRSTISMAIRGDTWKEVESE